LERLMILIVSVAVVYAIGRTLRNRYIEVRDKASKDGHSYEASKSRGGAYVFVTSVWCILLCYIAFVKMPREGLGIGLVWIIVTMIAGTVVVNWIFKKPAK
jgi:hypothetical protein